MTVVQVYNTKYWAPYGENRFKQEAADEYTRFRRCLPQLIDSDDPITGDLAGRWVIFQHGWVHGLTSYPDQESARAFAARMFGTHPESAYIVVQVDLDRHKVSALHALADAISELDSLEEGD